MAARSNSTSASSNKSTVDGEITGHPLAADRNLTMVLPGDNRDPRTRFGDDLRELATLASFLSTTMENKFSVSSPVKAPGGNRYFFGHDEEEALLLFFFDLDNRARSLALRRDAVLGGEGIDEADADAAWQAVERTAAPKGDAVSPLDGRDAVHDLECALSAIAGLIDAVNEMASGTKNPERRLSGIFAVTGALMDELRAADEAVGVLRRAKRSAVA